MSKEKSRYEASISRNCERRDKEGMNRVEWKNQLLWQAIIEQRHRKGVLHKRPATVVTKVLRM